MNIYLAKMTSQDEDSFFYDLVNADTPQEAREKVENLYLRTIK